MADKNINQVNKKTSIASTDQVFMSDGGTMLKKIDYNVLAKAIIEQYTGSTLGGSSQSLKTALDAISENKATNVCERLTSPDLLDTSIAPNNYYVTGATNAPEGASNVAGYFTVMCREGFDNTIRIVTFQPYLSYQKYVNMKMNSSDWSGWVAEPSREDFDDYSDGQIGLLVGKNIDDLHSEDTCGTYWLNNGATDVHGSFPSTGGQGLLFVKRQTEDLWRQTYIPISSGYDLKCRYYSTSTNEWTSWSDSNLATRIKGTLWRSINSGTTRTEVLDLIDSYFNETSTSRISGYMDATRSGYLGLPSTAHHIDVYSNSANYKLMVARSADGNYVYQLAKLAGAWESNWYTMTPFTRDGISSLDDIPIGTQGYAQFDASISPLGVQAYFTYWCTGTNDRRSIIAIITSQPTSRAFINTMHNVGVWKGWKEIEPDVSISALTTDATSGYVNLMRCGKVRIMTFTDVKASTTSINLSAALDTDDRPATFSNNVVCNTLFCINDNSCGRVWVRQAGTIGTSNIQSGKTYSGQIVYLTN